MITWELARQLQHAGWQWQPASGDRFVIPGRSMDNELFVISEMTIEVHEHFGGGVVKFNGTTEWALDSIEQSEVLWLPRESQLRAGLGESFVRLERTLDSWRVVVHQDGVEASVIDNDVECSYARAWLHLRRVS